MNRLLLLGSALLWVLFGCGGGGSSSSGGGGATYTVTTSAGANGSLNPATDTVASGATTFLLVTPNNGYTVDSISGCGGTLSGNTYTTGAITADCTVTVSFRYREFVWMGGSNTTGAPGVYGTLGVAAASNVPGARDSASSWTDANGKLWLFGGVGYDSTAAGGYLNDLWKYDPSSGQWTWESGSNTVNAGGTYGTQGTAAAGNVPPAREYAVTWTDANGNLWLFGGLGVSFNNYNDLWKYDPSSGQWTWESGSNTANASGTYGIQGTAAASNVPGARRSAVTWIDTNGNLWLFGGIDDTSSNVYNDLWKYDPSSGQWTWMSGSSSVNATGTYGTQGTAAASNVPGARRSAVSWTDANGNLWLFGGFDLSVVSWLNDLWIYDITSGQWTWMSGSNTVNATGTYGTRGTAAAGNVPGARSNAVSWTDADGKLWLFSGAGYDTSSFGLLNDLWRYDPVSGQWTWMNGSHTVGTTGTYGTQGTAAAGNVPEGRYDMVSWIDANGNPWLFGGYNDTDDFNDLWSYH